MKKRFPLTISVLAAVLLSLVLIGFRDSEPERLQLGFTPGDYLMVVNKYTRMGSETERSVHVLERATLEARFTLTPSRTVTNMSTLVTGDGRQYRITVDGNNEETITDLDSGESTVGDTLPAIAPPTTPVKQDVVDGLLASGMAKIGEKRWHGRSVEVYEAVGSPIGNLLPPAEGEHYYPVMHDLNPVSQRAGLYVDAATGMAVYSYRYVTDASGNETLIEWLEWTSIRKEG